MKFGAIITAGGSSKRFGNKNKLLEKINNKTIIEYTVEKFLKANLDEIVISANPQIIKDLENIFTNPKIKIVTGGATRQDSVYNGLQQINCDYVLIHDGARPLISPQTIEQVKKEVVEKKAVSVMTKTTDTIKEVDKNGKIIKTIDRTKLYNTQTPQAFEYNLIKEIHEKLKGEKFTDDCGMAEALGYDVYMVQGQPENIKITYQTDMKIAEILSNK